MGLKSSSYMNKNLSTLALGLLLYDVPLSFL